MEEKSGLGECQNDPTYTSEFVVPALPEPEDGGGGGGSVAPFTNTKAGTIKGSTNPGQIFAEPDATGSVNGWDATQENISNLTEGLSNLEEKVDGLEIPKLYDDYGENEDGAVTQKFVNDKLNTRKIVLGDGATGTGGNDTRGPIAIGYNAEANYGGIGIGTGALAGTDNVAIGHNSKAANTNTIAIGSYSSSDSSSVAVGGGAKASFHNVSLGYQAKATTANAQSVAIGYYAESHRNNEVSIGGYTGTSNTISKTRFLANVTAGELDTDAVNKKQMEDYVMEQVGDINSALTTLISGEGAN